MSEVQLRNRIAAYLSNPGAEFVDIAREHEAMPVYSDLGGTLFLTSTGAVLCLPEDGDELHEECSREWQLIAFVSAAEKFPELQCLLPARPAGAADCEQCSGRVVDGIRCGSCLGLGWRAS